MNKRITTTIATAMLVTLASGCCNNMRTLWFGRGASCGLCNKLPCLGQPKMGNVMPTPYRPQPFVAPAPTCPPAPVQAAPWQSPPWQAPAPCQAPAFQSAPSDCPCQGSGQQWSQGWNQGSGTNIGGDCNCGGSGQSFSAGSEFHDPYLSAGGDSFDGHNMGMPAEPYPGQVINGETVVAPGSVGQFPSNAPMSGDNFSPRPDPNFQSRKFDTEGNKILWEEPLPPGIRSQE